MMALLESTIVALAVGVAAACLLRGMWRHVRAKRRGGGCCGRCPVAGPKIRLAAKEPQVSIRQ